MKSFIFFGKCRNLAGLLGLVIWLIFFLPQAQAISPKNTLQVTPLSPAKKAPEFSLKDLAGKIHTMEALKGKTVLLNFWAPWCAPCLEEMPALKALNERFASEGLVILAVATSSKFKAVHQKAQELDLPFAVLFDEGSRVGLRYGARALPATFFIDRQGMLAGVAHGARHWNSPQSFKFFEGFLKEGAGKVPAVKETHLQVPAEIQPSEKPQIKVAGPSGSVSADNAFVVQIDITWLGETETYGIEPPEAQMPEHISFVSMGSSSQSRKTAEGLLNILHHDLYFFAEKDIPEGNLTLGPFTAYYLSADEEAVLEAPAIQLNVKGNNLRLKIIWGAFIAAIMIGYFFWIRRPQKAISVPSSEIQPDLKTELERADQLRVTGTPTEFYQKLIELIQSHSSNGRYEALLSELKPKLDQVRYGGGKPESRQMEADLQRVQRELTH